MKLITASVLFFILLVLPVIAYAADQGAISGTVINKTQGAGNVSRLKVTLNGTKADSSIPEVSTATNDKGVFEFKGVSVDASIAYKLSANHQGADYVSDNFSFKTGETQKEVELIVYDATSDSKDIKINISHMVVLTGKGSLQSQEYYALVNNGDKAYVGSRVVPSLNQKETFTASVPDDISSVEYYVGLMECCVVSEQGKLIDTMSINPGIKEIAFGYNFPYKSSKYTLNKTFEYPAEDFRFVVEDKGMQVSGSGLVSEGPVSINGRSFLVFSKKDIKANETVKINISGLPSAPVTGFLKWFAAGFVLLAIAAVLIYPRFRKSKLQAVPVAASERERLIKQIAKLDDDFEEGRIPEETYRRLRSQKKANLAELSRGKGRKGV